MELAVLADHSENERKRKDLTNTWILFIHLFVIGISIFYCLLTSTLNSLALVLDGVSKINVKLEASVEPPSGGWAALDNIS